MLHTPFCRRAAGVATLGLLFLAFHASIAFALPSTTPSWTVIGANGSVELGYSAASAGDVNGDGYADVVVGAIYDNCGALLNGCAYLYLGSPTGPSTSPDWTATSTFQNSVSSAVFGSSVASAGDVNGDGFDDVIVGALSDGPTAAGRAYLYFGSSTGLSTTPAWITPDLDQRQGQASQGSAVASAGDINGDGYSDIIVSAPMFTSGAKSAGRVFVYYGSPTGPSPQADWTADGNQTGEDFGHSVASAGDVNGDGFGDVIIGADQFHMGRNGHGSGSVAVYLGSPSGLGRKAAWVVNGDAMSSQFGVAVSGAGDVNGDGFGDVIIGDLGQRDPQHPLEGRAFVYLGSASGLSPSPAWVGYGNQQYGGFGGSVGAAGDINGDGFDDVLIGAPIGSANGVVNPQRAFLYLGSSSGVQDPAAWMVQGEAQNEYFGRPVAMAGDVNGDGLIDVLVASPGYTPTPGADSAGRVQLYLGAP